MTARHKRARKNAKKELSGYLSQDGSTIPIVQNNAPVPINDYPRQQHSCKLDYVDWEPYSNGKVLSIGKCKSELKKAA